jgi:hypothetical protein
VNINACLCRCWSDGLMPGCGVPGTDRQRAIRSRRKDAGTAVDAGSSLSVSRAAKEREPSSSSLDAGARDMRQEQVRAAATVLPWRAQRRRRLSPVPAENEFAHGGSSNMTASVLGAGAGVLVPADMPRPWTLCPVLQLPDSPRSHCRSRVGAAASR